MVQSGRDTLSRRAQECFEANKNVLVVEDDRVLGQMLIEILEDFGFNVTTASSGTVAIEKLEQQPIDFVVLDILLPEMSGFEVYASLQSTPEIRDTPVMIITAWSDEENIEKAHQLGIRHFLAKPFTEDELISTILTLLVDHPQQQS